MELDLSDVQLGSGKIHIALPARHLRAPDLHRGAPAPGAARRPHRPAQPRAVRRPRRRTRSARRVRSGESLALLLLDLDGFKHVNDTLGHQHGDVLLKLVAERLVGLPARRGHGGAARRRRVRDPAARRTRTWPARRRVAWKLQQALEPPFVVDGHAVEVTASIGITLVPEHGDNVDDLLRRADLAMYDAKRSGGGYALFAAEQEEAPARRLALLDDLRHCIERDELVLHYQPKIDLATRETIGVEALIRWNHPSGRLFMPAEFMPEVERSELMIPITEWVINEALRQLRTLARRGLRPDDGRQPRRPLPGGGHGALRDGRRADPQAGASPPTSSPSSSPRAR